MSDPETRIQVSLSRRDFSLEVDVAWNERVAVIFGPSGSGKTTLFETVLGLRPEARARIRLAGTWLDDSERGLHVPIQARALGWVPQDPALFPHLTVERNLRFGSARAAASGAHALERAIEVLEIRGLLARNVDRLSGGEKQRVAIARALASGPRALLLDEPLASLDLPLRARVLPYLLRVRDELDIPILYITHDPDEAILLGEVVAVLDAGRVVSTGAPREVLWNRAVLPLSEALGLENVLEAKVAERRATESTVEAPGGLRLVIPTALAVGERVTVGLRAQDVLLSADPPGRVSARNVFEATVSGWEQRDGSCFVRLHAQGGPPAGSELVAKLTPAAVEKLALRSGMRVYVVIKAQAIRRLA